MNYKLEIIGFNIESCLIAEQAGAHRIELCDSPGEGGTTPSYGFIKAARKALHIELYPIIRPRGGDFLYTDAEFEIMCTDITLCKNLGCDGVVTGILNADGTVDKKRCGTLATLAYPMEISFHRAFDRTADPFQAMEDIIEIGFERILTSGQQADALQGAKLISQLIDQADDRIIIMPGSGIRPGNIIDIARETGALEFHSSARTDAKSQMGYLQQSWEKLPTHTTVNSEEVKSLLSSLLSLNS